MRTLLPLGALLALGLASCTSSASSLMGPDELKPSFACAGNSGNCGGGQQGGGQQGGGQHNNNPNNPPATAP